MTALICPWQGQHQRKQDMRRLLLACSMFVSLSALPVHAATLSVSPSGNDSNPCTASAPCRTVNGGALRLHSGDTLVLAPGTYAETLEYVLPSGTTLRAATPGTAILQAPSRDGTATVAIRGSGITLDGLVLDGNHLTRGLEVEGQGHRIRNTEIRYGRTQGVRGTCWDCVFDGVDVHHNGYTKAGVGDCYSGGDGKTHHDGFCHGFYIQQGAPTRLTVRNSRMWGNDGYGFQSYQTDVTLEGNVFYDNYTGGVIIVGPGGTVRNNTFAGEPTPILCNGCIQEGNRFVGARGRPRRRVHRPQRARVRQPPRICGSSRYPSNGTEERLQ